MNLPVLAFVDGGALAVDPHRFIDADERGVQRRGVHAPGDKIRAVRMAPQVAQALAAERHVRSDNDVACPDCAVSGIDDGRGPVVDSFRAGLLEDEAAAGRPSRAAKWASARTRSSASLVSANAAVSPATPAPMTATAISRSPLRTG